MKTPFFSVIIPLYNKEKYVERAILSIQSQTYTNFEIIIVNDGSTDNGLEKLNPFLSEKIRLIEHAKNKGLSAARNTGIQSAKATYIVFLDADDTWLPTYLEAIKNLIENFGEARIFATNMQYVYPKQTIAIDNKLSNYPIDYKGYVDFFKENIKQGLYCINSVCYHQSVFEKVGYFDEKITFSEEIDFYIRAHLQFKFAYDTTVHTNYFMEIENQLSHSSILNKTIPNYDLYESYSDSEPHFKKFLDIQRYVLAKNLKKHGDKSKHLEITKNIDYKNLNLKQQFLLKSPLFLLKNISALKQFLVKNGFSWTSYSN
jgi:glycosyltransferase involved in cell wall biosynthesis